jgi:calcium-dependent protein kinase
MTEDQDLCAEPEPEDEDLSPYTTGTRRGRRHQRTTLRLIETMGQVSSSAFQLTVNNPGSFSDYYATDPGLLGKGSFGTVRRATVRSTGAARAVKSLSMGKMKDKVVALKREIRIMKLVDHPNLIMLCEIFEDSDFIHLVMDLCSGGNLRAQVKRVGHLTEAEAAMVMQQILRATAYLHNKHVCHRDIKALNCLLVSNEPLDSNRVKLVDFGLSCPCGPNDVLTARIGTRTHMAPEVWGRHYGRPCDLWSCGVVLYHLLSGGLPFDDNEEEIQQGQISFAAHVWWNISMPALEVVLALLTTASDKRSTAHQVQAAPWFKEAVPSTKAGPIKEDIIEHLRQFRTFSKFKRAALSVVASLLPDEQVSESRTLFISLDSNGDGSLSVAELRQRMEQQGQNEADVEGAFRDKLDAKASSGGAQSRNGGSRPTDAALRRCNSGQHQQGRDSTPRSTPRSGGTPRIVQYASEPASNATAAPSSQASARGRWETAGVVVKAGRRLRRASSAQGQGPTMSPSPRATASSPGRGPARNPARKRTLELEIAAPPVEKLKDFTYIEFLAATFDRKECLTEDVCRAAFESFDKNGDGSISLPELASGRLLGHLTIEELRETLKALDRNEDLYIDFSEFMQMMTDDEVA